MSLKWQDLLYISFMKGGGGSSLAYTIEIWGSRLIRETLMFHVCSVILVFDVKMIIKYYLAMWGLYFVNKAIFAWIRDHSLITVWGWQAWEGPMTPYTPLNIANIHNINLILLPPQYRLTPINIYEFLLPPLISGNPYYLLLIPTAPLNIN